MQKLRPHSRGSGLLLGIFLIAVALVIIATTAKIVFSGVLSANLELERVSAFYLAEAAIEYGKAEINGNSGWYTDLKRAEDKVWLMDQAAGMKANLGSGEYKIVRMKNDLALYGIGYYKKGCVVLKIDFTLPYHTERFSIL